MDGYNGDVFFHGDDDGHGDGHSYGSIDATRDFLSQPLPTAGRPSPALDPATSLLPVRAWRPSTSTRRAANGRPWEGTRASFASVFKVEMSTAPMPPLPLEPTAQAEVLELEVLASVLLAALELELGPGALPRRSPVVAVVVVCRLLVTARHKEASTARGRRLHGLR